MSPCTNSVRALARRQFSATAKSPLLPFLYQTATIRQWARKLESRLTAPRRYASSNYGGNRNGRNARWHDVPFETPDSLPLSIDSTVPASRKTTMTSTERAAFKRLYKEVQKEGEDEDLPFEQEEHDRIFDEYADGEEDDSSAADLDSVFDAVLSGLPNPAGSGRGRKPKETLETLAKSILKPEVDEIKTKSRERAIEQAGRMREIRNREKERVWVMLDEAKTDREIWEVLQWEVFDKMRMLNLDGVDNELSRKKSRQALRKQRRAAESIPLDISDFLQDSPVLGTHAVTDPTAPLEEKQKEEIDPRILFPNYPSLLVHAVSLLRVRFPQSQSPLSILPMLKSLGRSSYALAATTSLYNHLIRAVWVQHASYTYIDELLTDMDNGGIEFDSKTLELLDTILVEYEKAAKGRFGRLVKEVWSLEHMAEGARKLQGWREIARQRLDAWAGRRVRKGGAEGPEHFMGDSEDSIKTGVL
ncbi:hypothetical protein BCR34DRAFT_580967 [Clohesyomyces aquaticus]|uniref:Mtf2-like C-terminal domain-containing protein n=1 Tax=Clohesyomyces aquaticus TaxID=1231657 RepID=A0A1Y1Y4U2_9PLEO|nr:hypothetical protein BCR34DRAFT_580967 [Clohesyomyces aquaticus]